MTDVPRPGQRVLVTALGASDVPRTMRVGDVCEVEAVGESVGGAHLYVVLVGHPASALASITGDRWLVDPACVGIWHGQATA